MRVCYRRGSDFIWIFFVPSASTKHLKKQLHHMCYHVSPGLHVAVFWGELGRGSREGGRRKTAVQ